MKINSIIGLSGILIGISVLFLVMLVGVGVNAQRRDGASLQVKLRIMPRTSLGAGSAQKRLNETGMLNLSLHQDACIYLGTQDKRVVKVEVEGEGELEPFELNNSSGSKIPYSVEVNRDLAQNQFGAVTSGQTVGNGVHACGNGSVINTRFQVDPRYNTNLSDSDYSQNVNIVLSPP